MHFIASHDPLDVVSAAAVNFDFQEIDSSQK
jgi:hypothetical protein